MGLLETTFTIDQKLMELLYKWSSSTYSCPVVEGAEVVFSSSTRRYLDIFSFSPSEYYLDYISSN